MVAQSDWLPMMMAILASDIGRFPDRLDRFISFPKRRNDLTFCFAAIPDGKPVSTFPGIAQSESAFLTD